MSQQVVEIGLVPFKNVTNYEDIPNGELQWVGLDYICEYDEDHTRKDSLAELREELGFEFTKGMFTLRGSVLTIKDNTVFNNYLRESIKTALESDGFLKGSAFHKLMIMVYNAHVGDKFNDFVVAWTFEDEEGRICHSLISDFEFFARCSDMENGTKLYIGQIWDSYDSYE